jgi:hypothetical protein
MPWLSISLQLLFNYVASPTKNSCGKVFFFPWRNSPSWVRASSLSRLHDITLRHTKFGRNPLDKWSAQHKELWQHAALTTDIHAPGGFRTRNSCKQAAADPRLRPRGHWDLPRHIIRKEYCLLTGFFGVLEVIPAETVRKDMVTEKLLKITPPVLFVSESKGKHLKKYRYHTSCSETLRIYWVLAVSSLKHDPEIRHYHPHTFLTVV